ncbi:polyprenyl synthetase family protein [Rhodobiaceae bacterium]|mgnify:FL=1|jgi:geranylgeranyl pyrophosphate synthase|nr:polyprenyl synthetase family protein [Rhodobiaceae bacterium]|tara:strand:+ start:3993 stop:4886 length:894 start_codon:yes stop_codon:yes gene_type:complete
MDENFKHSLQLIAEKIEKNLDEILSPSLDGDEFLNEAMRYSVLGGGKRLRPFLAIECSSFFDVDTDDVIKISCAIELLHVYSLVHDDLPAIDDDDLRRGKLSNHKYFDEATAILVGDGLQALAFEILSGSFNKIKSKNQIELINLFSNMVGHKGMVGGQAIDIRSNQNEELNIAKLLMMYKMKTANLISFSCQAGAIISDSNNLKRKALQDFGDNLGLVFQITDDILDVIGESSVIGKQTGSDIKNKKITFLDYYDIDQARLEINKYCDYSISSLNIFDQIPPSLLEVVNFVKEREF